MRGRPKYFDEAACECSVRKPSCDLLRTGPHWLEVCFHSQYPACIPTDLLPPTNLQPAPPPISRDSRSGEEFVGGKTAPCCRAGSGFTHEISASDVARCGGRDRRVDTPSCLRACNQ